MKFRIEIELVTKDITVPNQSADLADAIHQVRKKLKFTADRIGRCLTDAVWYPNRTIEWSPTKEVFVRVRKVK